MNSCHDTHHLTKKVGRTVLSISQWYIFTEKVSFNIASEASYDCGQTVLPDRSVLIGQKLVENAKVRKVKCDILGDFQTLCGELHFHIKSRIDRFTKMY